MTKTASGDPTPATGKGQALGLAASTLFTPRAPRVQLKALRRGMAAPDQDGGEVLRQRGLIGQGFVTDAYENQQDKEKNSPGQPGCASRQGHYFSSWRIFLIVAKS